MNHGEPKIIESLENVPNLVEPFEYDFQRRATWAYVKHELIWVQSRHLLEEEHRVLCRPGRFLDQAGGRSQRPKDNFARLHAVVTMHEKSLKFERLPMTGSFLHRSSSLGEGASSDDGPFPNLSSSKSASTVDRQFGLTGKRARTHWGRRDTHKPSRTAIAGPHWPDVARAAGAAIEARSATSTPQTLFAPYVRDGWSTVRPRTRDADAQMWFFDWPVDRMLVLLFGLNQRAPTDV